MNKEVEKIARGINSYIESQINSIKEEDEKWKTHYETVIEEIKSEIEHTKEDINDYGEENLTVNKIESEGYLRGLITMLNNFEQWKPREDGE